MSCGSDVDARPSESQFVAAAASPARLTILKLGHGGREFRRADAARAIGGLENSNNVGHHLKALIDAGLVVKVRHGIYRLLPPGSALTSFFDKSQPASDHSEGVAFALVLGPADASRLRALSDYDLVLELTSRLPEATAIRRVRLRVAEARLGQ
jgi:DNA-binding transcriptional ArsR family regulator